MSSRLSGLFVEKIKFYSKVAMRDGIFSAFYRILKAVIITVVLFFLRKDIDKLRCPYIVQLVHGSPMLLRTQDEGISFELYLNKGREPYFNAEFCKVLERGQTVIDIGANLGYYVLQEARIIRPGIVHAIEPVSNNVDLLRKNIRLNSLSNVEVHHLAIGNQIGETKIGISKHSNRCSINNTCYQCDSEITQMLTLDKFVEIYKIKPNVIRMDAEGYEYEIIKGGIETLRKSNIILCIELHIILLNNEPSRYSELIDTLKSLNYEIVFASIEPHPIVNIPYISKSGLIMPGIFKTTLDDLLTDKSFQSLDAIEIILKKKGA